MKKETDKPVHPTTQKEPSTKANNPDDVRAERPPAHTQSPATPSGEKPPPRGRP
ncbi:MAG TPA: hypothetical protein VGG34_03005 [Opitutaceae bacterium]|jgi:hypothetical protein